MRLEPAQFHQLHTALLHAFPRRGDLELMLRSGMGVRLEQIAAGDQLSKGVLDVINWAEAQGRLPELIQAARAQNPGNQELKECAVALSGADASARSGSSSAKAQSPGEGPLATETEHARTQAAEGSIPEAEPDPEGDAAAEPSTAAEPERGPDAPNARFRVPWVEWFNRLPWAPGRSPTRLIAVAMLPALLLAFGAASAGQEKPCLVVGAILWLLLRLSMSGSLRAAVKAAWATTVPRTASLAVGTGAFGIHAQHLFESRGGSALDTVGWVAAGTAAGLLIGCLAQRKSRTVLTGVLAREVPILLWVLLALATPPWENGRQTFQIVWAVLFGLIGPGLAWWEGDALEPRTHASGMAAVLAASCRWQLVAAAHDFPITHVLVPAPFRHTNTAAVFYFFAFAGMALTAGYLALRVPFAWRAPASHELIKQTIDGLLDKDPTGTAAARLRHVVFHHSGVRRVASSCIRIWEVLLGRFPREIVPSRRGRRYRQILRQLLADEEREAEKRLAAWRLGTMARPGTSTLSDRALLEALTGWGKLLLALGNRLDCPVEGCRYRSELLALKMAGRTDAFLTVARWLPGLSTELREVLRELERRLEGYCEYLAARPGGLGADFAALRRDQQAARRNRQAVELEDRELLQLRELALEVCREEGERVDGSGTPAARRPKWGWAAWAGSVLLAELALARDWEGLIEAGWRLEQLAGNAPAPGAAGFRMDEFAHRCLGEAWWCHAAELGPGPLGDWAFEQAIGHFVIAGAGHHLAVARLPKREKQADDTPSKRPVRGTRQAAASQP